jgi:hypothetical protein
MNLQTYPYEMNRATKCAIESINKNSVYTHIPWVGKCISIPDSNVYKNFVKNVVDGFIFMPHHFLYSKQFTKHRKELFENTNVYHIMMNKKHDTDFTSIETVTIFCKKGKTTTTKLSFEKNHNFAIRISLTESQIINMNNYVGLCEGFDIENLISYEFKDENKSNISINKQCIGRTLRKNNVYSDEEREKKRSREE